MKAIKQEQSKETVPYLGFSAPRSLQRTCKMGLRQAPHHIPYNFLLIRGLQPLTHPPLSVAAGTLRLLVAW